MKITDKTPIHYFIKDESNENWHKIELEAYLEIPQHNNVSNFQIIEDIRLFISKDLDKYEVGRFYIDFGRNSCTSSWAKKLPELVKEQERDAPIRNFKKVKKADYLKLRNKAFEIYLIHPKTDFTKLKIGSEYN